jgi:HAD superfamily hydrolase (TIGR01549 family)
MNLLFDFDGTLFDYQKSLILIIKKICRELCIEYSDDMIKRFEIITVEVWNKYQSVEPIRNLNKRRFTLLLESYNLKISISDIVEKFKEYRLKTVCLYKESLEVCKKLSKKNNLLIVSNGNYEIQESLLKKSGLGRYIKNLVTSEIVKTRKPDKNFLLRTFDLYNIKVTDSILIGDSILEDIECAKKIELPNIWINRFENLEIKPSCDYIISDLSELFKVIPF